MKVRAVSENGTIRFLIKTALEINLFGIARLDSTRLPYMVTLVTIYGNRCMGGRERSSEDHVIGVVFDEESHGNIRFYSFGRRYTVLKQTPRMPWHIHVCGSHRRHMSGCRSWPSAGVSRIESCTAVVVRLCDGPREPLPAAPHGAQGALFLVFCFLPPSYLLQSPGPPTYRDFKSQRPCAGSSYS